MKLEQKAKEFAAKAHKKQFRKDKVTPYITHCKGVVNLLSIINITDQDTICSTWLHDVIEDCGVTRKQLEQEFNQNIARIVSILTRDVDRKTYKERIKNSDYQVQIIKLADTVHNCSEMTQDISTKTIKRKIEDCDSLYLELARNICPSFHSMLTTYLEPFRT